MKNTDDITMRGRPAWQEMLQLEAATPASYSHKVPGSTHCSCSTVGVFFTFFRKSYLQGDFFNWASPEFQFFSFQRFIFKTRKTE